MSEVVDAALATAGKTCDLGTDPSKYLEKFEDWYEHTSLLADSIGVKDKKQKLRLLLLWGGRQFRKFAKEAKVTTEGDTPDTLEQAITKIREQCGAHVNLSMAVFKLMHARQGTKTVTEFARELEELAAQCQFDTKPYTQARAMKDAFIFGTSDDKLRQEALAKDFEYAHLMKAALGYEQSRRASGTIKQTSGEEVRQVSYTQDEVDAIVARVTAGRYSNRRPQAPKSGTPQPTSKCRSCPPHYKPHGPGKCPAVGKTCVVCKRKNHFAGSSDCPASRQTTVKAVTVQHEDTYSYYDSDQGPQPLGYVEVVNVSLLQDSLTENTISVTLNGVPLQLFVDSGCKKTLLPQSHYRPELGLVRPSPIRLRPYGTTQYLKVEGELPVIIQSMNGAKHNTKVYIVNGHLAEPLLGDEDAKALGILAINPGGHSSPHPINAVQVQPNSIPVAGITANLRAAGVVVRSTRGQDEIIPIDERNRIQSIVDHHPQVVSQDMTAVGLLTDARELGDAAVRFHVNPLVPPVAARYHPPPLAYQDQLSKHLQELRDSDKIENVDPNEYCPWVSNVVITEKKQQGQIRMNIDMRQPNKALLRTPRHIETVQEIRHKLQGATRFSELDLGHGYHQIPLAEESRYLSTFQTHEGLHRFKVLFFGASPASDLFHDKIKTAMQGLPGCISIHDNILVWGTSDKEHEENLEACLQRMEDRGLTARFSKCNFGKTSVAWFGWIFSKDGMSADPRKIQSIVEAGRPQSTDDVKSFLQACQFNARFMLESDQAYAQLTEPLRALTKKNARFQWTPECEQCYEDIVKAMTSDTALRPFDPQLKTILVTDAGPGGIAASIFQELDDGTWVPIDHASRSLTPCEKNYSQIEKESLAQAWGMTTHRFYLLGIKFESYTDHQPLIPIYSGNKRGNARVERHRLKVQGFQYDMKYLPGKDNPCDYQSRHPLPLDTFSDRQLDEMLIDRDDELCISKIVTDDLPDAVTLPMIQAATAQDPVLQKLLQCIKKGYIGSDPALKPYRPLFQELSHSNGVILRGDRLVIPDIEFMPGAGSLRQVIVDLAHEGHQGVVKCKQLLRSRLWFPQLDKLVEDRVAQCIACQAATYHPTRDPLIPTALPERPWQDVDMDFWGPLPSGEHLLVIIDEYSRYPEVEIVNSTSATAVIPHVDRVFATHGFPERVKTDGGPPFNGTDSHDFKMYMKWAGVKHTVVSPEDPEANGLAENFMKMVKKVWHTTRTEKKSFKQELYKYLRHYRATPHSSTGKPPAELLFNRKIRTRLPVYQEPAQDNQVRQRDAHAKAVQKAYKDAKANVHPHNIHVGDHVLILQRQSKTHSRYDPEPYRVTEIWGSQIKAVRGDKVRLRDAKMFKKVVIQDPRAYHHTRYPLDLGEGAPFTYNGDEDLGLAAGAVPTPPPSPQPGVPLQGPRHPAPASLPQRPLPRAAGAMPASPPSPPPGVPLQGPQQPVPAAPHQVPLPRFPAQQVHEPLLARPGTSTSAAGTPPLMPITHAGPREVAPTPVPSPSLPTSPQVPRPLLAHPGHSSSASGAPPLMPPAHSQAKRVSPAPTLHPGLPSPPTLDPTSHDGPPLPIPITSPTEQLTPRGNPLHPPSQTPTPDMQGATAHSRQRSPRLASMTPPGRGTRQQGGRRPSDQRRAARPPARGRGHRLEPRYPNRHLDPNIDIQLWPEDRRRQRPRRYDADTGTWN